MSRYEIYGGLGIGFVGGALLVLLPGAGWGLAFLFIGLLLIAHVVLGKKREQGAMAVSLTPSAKELHEEMEAKARSQKALIDLASAQREQRIEGFVDFLEQDFNSKVIEAKKRGAVFNRTGYLEHPKATEGESQQEVDEAYHRFCMRKGFVKLPLRDFPAHHKG
jgi:hypothetical protein